MIISEPVSSYGITLIPKFSAIAIDVSEIEPGLLVAVYAPWTLCTFADNEESLHKEIAEQIIFLWQEYALADDSSLSLPAQRLKRQLLKDWVEKS